MVKLSGVAFFLATFSAYISAQQADSCSGLAPSALAQCRGSQQKVQLEQLQQQVQQQQERQKQLDEQQRQIQQQLEDMRLQNDKLRAQLALDQSANQPGRPAAIDYSRTQEVRSWKSDNPWFGSDYAKTEFAIRYAKQLQRERPDLVGRPFLDALSAKVNENFAAKKW